MNRLVDLLNEYKADVIIHMGVPERTVDTWISQPKLLLECNVEVIYKLKQIIGVSVDNLVEMVFNSMNDKISS